MDSTGALAPAWWLLTLAALMLAWLLRSLRPAQRRGLRSTWVLLALSVLVQLLHALAVASQAHGLAQGLLAAVVVLTVLATIRLAGVLLFELALPVVNMATPRIVQELVTAAASLVWVLLWLHLQGMDPSQLFTTSAVITAVLAFSMQDTLGNVLGGVVLQLDSSLHVGEWVRVDDISGRVVDVRWRFTAIETRNGETVIVPNSWLMKNRFVVLRVGEDGPALWRRTLNFQLDTATAPDLVIAALERALIDATLEHVAVQPAPNAVLMEATAGYRRYALRYWLNSPLHDDGTDSLVRIHALAALERAGVRQGVPQEERLMITEDDNWSSANARREMARRLDAIRRTELFASLPQVEQNALAQHLIHAPFAAGDTITRQGAVAHWLYLIIRGEADVVVQSAGVSDKVATLRDGDLFGEMGMLTGEPRRASVLAATDVECYRLDKDGFGQVLKSRPGMARDITAILERRQAELDERIRRSSQTGPAPKREDLLERMLTFFGVGSHKD